MKLTKQQNDKQASKYSEFSDRVTEMERLRAGDTSGSNDILTQTVNKDSSIAIETELVREIKDILDELNSIQKVFREQIHVARLFSKGYKRVLDQVVRQRQKALDAGERLRLDLRKGRREDQSGDDEARDDDQRSLSEATAIEEHSMITHRQISQWQYREPIVAIFEDQLSEFSSMEYQARRTYDAVTPKAILTLLIAFTNKTLAPGSFRFTAEVGKPFGSLVRSKTG